MIRQNSLGSLSDSCVLDKIRYLANKENHTTVELLLFLAELDKRKLYLPKGYSSLFDFCTRALRYSEGATHRRISSARTLDKFPEFKELLLSKKVTLCTLSLAAQIINENNKEQVIKAISGRSKREAEKALMSLRQHTEKPKESIRPVKNIPKKAPEVTTPLFSKTEVTEKQTKKVAEIPTDNKKINQPETLMEFKFSVSNESFHKYQEVQALLSGKYPRGAKLDQIFDEMLECYLEKHSPKRRKLRRDKRKDRNPASKKNASSKRSRHIPKAVRDNIYVRDGGMCTYVGEDGQRCNSCHDLEVHHVKPYAKNGSHNESNLALLCREHNAYQATLDFSHQKNLCLHR